MKCESGSCLSLRLNIPQFVPKVKFINDSANLGEIPLNLPTKVIAVLQNFEFNEMAYEVDCVSLIRGCDVNPLRGKISPRGIVILEVCFLYTNKFKHTCMYVCIYVYTGWSLHIYMYTYVGTLIKRIYNFRCILRSMFVVVFLSQSLSQFKDVYDYYIG